MKNALKLSYLPYVQEAQDAKKESYTQGWERKLYLRKSFVSVILKLFFNSPKTNFFIIIMLLWAQEYYET